MEKSDYYSYHGLHLAAKNCTLGLDVIIYFLKKLFFNPLFSELVMLCQEAIFLTLKSLMLCDCILPTIIDPKHDGTGVPSLKQGLLKIWTGHSN